MRCAAPCRWPRRARPAESARIVGAARRLPTCASKKKRPRFRGRCKNRQHPIPILWKQIVSPKIRPLPHCPRKSQNFLRKLAHIQALKTHRVGHPKNSARLVKIIFKKLRLQPRLRRQFRRIKIHKQKSLMQWYRCLCCVNDVKYHTQRLPVL